MCNPPMFTTRRHTHSAFGLNKNNTGGLDTEQPLYTTL